jgi:hypothetical protein
MQTTSLYIFGLLAGVTQDNDQENDAAGSERLKRECRAAKQDREEAEDLQ